MKLRKILACVLAAGIMVSASAMPVSAATNTSKSSSSSSSSSIKAPKISVSVNIPELTVKWTNNKKADKIELYYSADGSKYTKFATTEASRESYVAEMNKNKFKGAKKVYVKARFYSVVNGKKVYSNYGKASKPLTGLSAYGLEPTATLNVAYSYTTSEYENPKDKLEGTVTFRNFSRLNLDSKYDQVTVIAEMRQKKGFYYAYGYTDYYNYEKGASDDETEEFGENFTITWKGKKYTKCYVDAEVLPSIYEVRFTAKVPKGYNGVVVWVMGYDGNEEKLHKNILDLNSAEGLVMYRFN